MALEVLMDPSQWMAAILKGIRRPRNEPEVTVGTTICCKHASTIHHTVATVENAGRKPASHHLFRGLKGSKLTTTHNQADEDT